MHFLYFHSRDRLAMTFLGTGGWMRADPPTNSLDHAIFVGQNLHNTHTHTERIQAFTLAGVVQGYCRAPQKDCG
jgi:hypothetical protein